MYILTFATTNSLLQGYSKKCYVFIGIVQYTGWKLEVISICVRKGSRGKRGILKEGIQHMGFAAKQA